METHILAAFLILMIPVVFIFSLVNIIRRKGSFTTNIMAMMASFAVGPILGVIIIVGLIGTILFLAACIIIFPFDLLINRKNSIFINAYKNFKNGKI